MTEPSTEKHPPSEEKPSEPDENEGLTWCELHDVYYDEVCASCLADAEYSEWRGGEYADGPEAEDL